MTLLFFFLLLLIFFFVFFFFFQAEDGIRDLTVTGVQTCALPIWPADRRRPAVSVRRHVDAGGRPRRSVGGRRGPPPVPREARHHEGHRPTGLWSRRRHAHQGGDQGD